MKDYIKTFRSALFGFNRRDVVACIKVLAAETDELRGLLSESRALCETLTEENARLSSSGAELFDAETKIASLSSELADAREAYQTFKTAELEKTSEKLREIERRHSETGAELRRLLEEMRS